MGSYILHWTVTWWCHCVIQLCISLGDPACCLWTLLLQVSPFSSVDPLNKISCYVNTFDVDFLKGNEVILIVYWQLISTIAVLIELDFIIISKQFILSCLLEFTLIIKLYYKQNDLHKQPKINLNLWTLNRIYVSCKKFFFKVTLDCKRSYKMTANLWCKTQRFTMDIKVLPNH